MEVRWIDGSEVGASHRATCHSVGQQSSTIGSHQSEVGKSGVVAIVFAGLRVAGCGLPCIETARGDAE